MKEKDAKKVCTLNQDDEFGLEVLRGAEVVLKGLNMALPGRGLAATALLGQQVQDQVHR